MGKYKVFLYRKDIKGIDFQVIVKAENEELAILVAKKFASEKGDCWLKIYSTEDRMERLIVSKIIKLFDNKSYCKYRIKIPSNEGYNCLAHYNEDRDYNNFYFNNYPCCNEKNCPFKNTEILKF